MESKDELNEINVKNRTCYHFDDTIRAEGFELNNNLLAKKSYKNSFENILIFDIAYKTFIGTKPLQSKFDKMDGFVKIYDGFRYLVLLGPEK